MQSEAGITNLGKSYHKVGEIIYCKVSQSLLQGWKVLLNEGSILQNGAGIANRGNYYKKGPYVFVALGQIETHVY